MVELIRWKLLFFVLAISSTAYGNEYSGFTKLDPSQCVPLNKEQVVSQVPDQWHKFAGFIKVCPLKQGKTGFAHVSILSIWAHEYLESQPPNAPWQGFPLPIIINNHFERIGQLSELYPSDWVTDLKVHYGKWQHNIPTEIRVDVENPAVSGDYYYAPLIWNEKRGSYLMRSKETINGRRPR